MGNALAGYTFGEIVLTRVPRQSRTGQAFFLERRRGRVRILYTTDNSLENAIYTLLDRWGFHWYGPGEHWFVRPARVPDADIPGRWREPTFRNRTFFGTGGLDTPVPGDPTNRYKDRWYAWKRRNRFNADFAAVGHTGQAFYQENRALCDSHPEWFNGDSGRQFGRFRIEATGALDAYRAWIGRQRAAARTPFVNLGVDPEDGRGMADDPLPPDSFAGITGWNHADKWWWVANQVARDYPENAPEIAVSMYAYGDGPTNVLVPKFPLRRNVYPVIIPYAFQTGYLPQEMVRAWARSGVRRLGIYDYWNITQWSLGVPQFDIHALRRRLSFWREQRIDGLYIETTDAAGPMGHAWWLAGQLAFDLDCDFEAAYTQYLDDLFGPAAPVLRRMFDRWSLRPQGAGEVSLSLADLRDADRRVARGSAEARRINDLKAYVHYLKLFYAHDGTQASKDRLFRYLYGIHDRMLVQTSAFVGQAYIAPLERGNHTPSEPVASLTPAEIDALFEDDLRDATPPYRVYTEAMDLRRAAFVEPVAHDAWRFGRNPEVYFVAPRHDTIAFEAGVEGGGVSDVTVFTETGVVLRATLGEAADRSETFAGRTWRMRAFTLPVRAGVTYHLRLRGSFNRLVMRAPLVLFNAHHGDDFDNYAYPVHYLYVPEGCSQLVYEDTTQPSAPHGTFFLPGGPERRAGEPLGVKNLYRVALPPAWRGKVIGCAFSHTSWRILNVPAIVSLQRFTYSETAAPTPAGTQRPSRPGEPRRDIATGSR